MEWTLVALVVVATPIGPFAGEIHWPRNTLAECQRDGVTMIASQLGGVQTLAFKCVEVERRPTS